MADGKVVIDTEIDKSGIKNGMGDIQKYLKRITTSVEGIAKSFSNAFRDCTDNMNAAAQSVDNLQKKAGKANKNLQSMSELKISHGESAKPDDYDGPLRESIEVDTKNLGYSKEIVQEIERSTKEEVSHVNEIRQEIQETKNILKDLEGKGFWWGDEEYNKKAAQLETVKQIAKELKKEAISDNIESLFSSKSIEGRLDAARAKLEKLTQSGVSIEDPRMQEAVKQVAELQEAYKKAYIEASKTDSQRKMENTRISELNAKLEQTRAKEIQAALEAKELKAIADNAEISDQHIAGLNRELQELAQRQAVLKEAGLGFGYEEFDKNAERIAGINSELKEYEKSITLSDTAAQKSSGSSRVLSSVLKSLKKTLSSIVRKVGQLASSLGKNFYGGLKKVSAGILGIHKSANKTTLSIKTLLKYGLGIRSLFVLFNRMRGAAVDGFKNLARYSNSTNANISMLVSALTRLKNSFATAFNPILSIASPLLTSFINLTSRAVTYVGMLIAALTGQDTFTKAIAVQEDYSASLDHTSKSANKASKATKKYLSELDEISRYDNSENDSDIGGGSGYNGPSPGEMFETVPINSTIKDLADKIRKIIESQDWEGLGEYVADGINSGMQKIYDVLSWDNVGPRVTGVVTAFTTTFNALAKNIDWDLMGATMGTGMNTAIRTLNLLIGNGGIDFDQIGEKLAEALRGMIRELDWNALGELLGNKFMIPWRMLSGFVKEMGRKDGAGITGWRTLGNGIGRAMTSMFKQISTKDIANALVGVINGAFQTLAGFNGSFDWESFKANLKSGIKTAINGIEWKENGKTFGEFLSSLCDCIKSSMDRDTFYELGKGVGEFLGELPWSELLVTAAGLLIDGLRGALAGLKESGTAGSIAAFLTKAFIAVKISNILGISSLVGKVIGKIAEHFATERNTTRLAQKLGEVIGSSTEGASGALEGLGGAASGASGGFGGLASSIAPLVGAAGLIVGVGAACELAFEGLAKFVDKFRGGNGDISEFGGAMDSFIQKLSTRGDILSGTADELFLLKESLEKQNMTADETKEATQRIIDKLGEYGVTSSQAIQALDLLRGSEHALSDDMYNYLIEAVKTLGDETTNMAGQIDLASLDSSEAFAGLEDAVRKMTNEMGLAPDQIGPLNQALYDTKGNARPAQEAYENLMQTVEDMGLNTETAAKIIAEIFPDAVKEVKKTVDENIPQAQETISSSMGTAQKDVSDSASSIKKDVEEMSGGVEKSISDSYGNAETTTETTWDNSYGAVAENLAGMESETKRVMNEVMTTIQLRWASVLKNTNQIWDKIAQKIKDKLGEVAGDAESLTGDIAGSMNRVIEKINGTIRNINGALSGVERAFTFSYDYTNPETKTRYWGSHSLSLSRVGTIPYLATGAVIPPRSEFLAVLGDQKHGNNIEAPEELIRKIVREESGSNREGNAQYRFTAQINRRTLFEEMMSEAELVRSQTGRNPFDME